MTNWNAFDRDLGQAFAKGTIPDADKAFISTPAPNALEWCMGPQYLNDENIITHFGSYQMVRDFFELLCPNCKRPGDDLCHFVDSKGDWQTKPRSVLEAQPLLVWSDTHQDDVCPKCGTTRYEFIFDKKLRGINQGILIAGQRCMRLDSLIQTAQGLITFDELLSGTRSMNTEQAHDYTVVTETGTGRSVGVTYAGKKASCKIETRLGFFQEVGEEHPVRVLRPATLQREWVRAKDLQVGDYLMVRIGANLFGTREMHPDAARLLGGIDASEKLTSEIPSAIRCSTREVQLNYLAGYFSRLGAAGAWHDCRKFLAQLQVLLLNLGVVSCIQRVPGSMGVSWVLEVLQEFELPFVQLLQHLDTIHYLTTSISTEQPIVDPNWLYVPIRNIEVGEAEMADLRVPDGECYVANGILNHNSGKSVAAGAYIATYLEHRLITLGYSHPGRLQGIFRGPKNDQFEVTLVASTQTQSDQTIFGKYKNARRESPWFRRVIPWIKQQEALQTTPKGMLPWRYNETLTEVEHGYLNLLFVSQNSNSDAQRGRTRLGSFIDELCYIGDGDSAFSARQVYVAQDNSLATAQRYVANQYLPPFIGLILAVSSPKAYNDYGMELLRRAPETNQMWHAHVPTWHFNPFEPRSRFEDRRIKDPIAWQVNFLAQPPATSSPLIADWPRWRRSVEMRDGRPTAKFRTVLDHYEDIQLLGVELESCDFLLPDEENDFYVAPRIITMDAGKSFDAFALACGHREFDQNGDAVTQVDWVYRVVPQPGLEPHFASIVDVVLELAKRQPIILIRMDHWNSARTTQDLRKMMPGVSVMEESMPNEAMIVAMRDGYSGRLRLLPAGDFDTAPPDQMSAMGAVYHEFQKLQRDHKDKVFNPDKGKVRGQDSDDLARCVGHLHWLVQRFDYVANEHDKSREAKAKRARAHASRSERHLDMRYDPTGLQPPAPPRMGQAPDSAVRSWVNKYQPQRDLGNATFNQYGVNSRNSGSPGRGGNKPGGRGW